MRSFYSSRSSNLQHLGLDILEEMVMFYVAMVAGAAHRPAVPHRCCFLQGETRSFLRARGCFPGKKEIKKRLSLIGNMSKSCAVHEIKVIITRTSPPPQSA